MLQGVALVRDQTQEEDDGDIVMGAALVRDLSAGRNGEGAGCEGEGQARKILDEETESDSDEPRTQLDPALFRLAAAAAPPRF
eukprot:2120471-Rhodomonas_salina.1